MKLIEDRTFIFDSPKSMNFKYIIKKILYPLREIACNLTIKNINLLVNSHKYNVVICSIFKNEAAFMQEWIIFHKIVGVEHFYLYNHSSADDYKKVLDPFIRDGSVTLIDWPETSDESPDNPAIFNVYKNWYENYRQDTQWCCFLDLDEYLCPKYSPNINEYLTTFIKYPCVIVYWKFFCSSGNLYHDFSKLVEEQYITCYPKMLNIGRTIYNTNFDIDFNDKRNKYMMHRLYTKFDKKKLPPYNSFRRPVVWDIDAVSNKGKFDIQVNHYWSKAYAEFCKKAGRGDAFWTEDWRTPIYKRNELNCIDTDYVIFRFMVQVKLELEKINGKSK